VYLAEDEESESSKRRMVAIASDVVVETYIGKSADCDTTQVENGVTSSPSPPP
jgi:hypothetical protein